MDYYIHPTCQIQGLNEIYKSVFGYKEDGFFVDVGAYDGITYSNTYGLAKAGWSGIVIEPVLKYFLACEDNYKEFKEVKLLRFAVGSKMSLNGIIHTGDHAVSTISEDFKSRIENTYYGKNLYTSKEHCYIDTLNSILDALYGHLDSRKPFDVLSIDVEGYELEVIKGFTVDVWKPKMVIIEAHELHKGEDRPVLYPEINKYFLGRDYSKIYCDEINNIYVRE
jgi:FkbM family methyltransferase